MAKYIHPEPYMPDYDYITGVHKADEHIRKLTHEDPHPGQAQHLGGMASYKTYLQEANHGEAHMVKKELKRAIDYLYYYSQTGHDIYKFMAEDALKHIDQLCCEIMDDEEKNKAKYFLELAQEYLSDLHHAKNGTSPATRPDIVEF